jgi:hypothetical protein
MGSGISFLELRPNSYLTAFSSLGQEVSGEGSWELEMKGNKKGARLSPWLDGVAF